MGCLPENIFLLLFKMSVPLFVDQIYNIGLIALSDDNNIRSSLYPGIIYWRSS